MEIKEIIKKAEEFVEKANEQLPGIIELEFRGLYEAGIFVTREKAKLEQKRGML